MFLKNRNVVSKIKRSKVTDYAALKREGFFYIRHKYRILLNELMKAIKYEASRAFYRDLFLCSILILANIFNE